MQGQPVVSQDIWADDRFKGVPPPADKGTRTLAVAPIFLPGRTPYGLLQVDDPEPGCLDSNDAEFLRAICSILGAVIDRLFKLDVLRDTQQRFRMTVEAVTDYAIFMMDPQGLITDWLPGAAAVFGWIADEALGQPVAITFTPEDRATGQPEQELETASREGLALNIREHLRKDGSRVLIEGIARALFDPNGNLIGFIKIGQDVTDRHQSERRLRILMEGIPQLVWRSQDTGQWTWASAQWMSFTGQDQNQASGQGWLDAVHPDDRDLVTRAWAEAADKDLLDVEHRIRRAADGAYLWHHTRSLPVRDKTGRTTEWLGTSTDVQAQKELQERQQVLVAELQHRTRNLIGVIRSIAIQTMATTGPTQVFLDRFGDRLSALSRVQGLLSRAEQEPITLRALLLLELDALAADGSAEITLEGPSVRIRPTLVQTLALGLHELATNARKYGALSGSGGRLTIRWHLHEAPPMRHLMIEWREEGLVRGAAGEPEHQGGYGRRLIERALPYSLGAQTTYHLGPNSLVCTIDLPLDRASRAEGG